MSDIVDTLINIEIFAFIGLLIYLYLRPSHLESLRTSDDQTGKPDRPE